MIVVAWLLVMIGTADAIRGMLRSRHPRVEVWAMIAAVAVAVAGIALSAVPPAFLLSGAIAVASWVALTPTRRSATRWPLLFLALVIPGFWLLAGDTRGEGPLQGWFEQRLGDSTLLSSSTELVLLLGLLLVMLETANIVVRAVLAADGGLLGRPLSEETSGLKGGRIIGPLERLLVLGLAASGQFAAIGGVLAAKGVVRFPEISRSVREGRQEGDRTADPEYFLIGSLASWGLALLGALLLNL